MESEGYLSFSKQCHSSLSWNRLTVDNRPSYLFISILILSSHLQHRLQRNVFPLGFPIKSLYAFLFTFLNAICPNHPLFLDFINLLLFGEEKTHEDPHCAISSSLLLLSFPQVEISSRYFQTLSACVLFGEASSIINILYSLMWTAIAQSV